MSFCKLRHVTPLIWLVFKLKVSIKKILFAKKFCVLSPNIDSKDLVKTTFPFAPLTVEVFMLRHVTWNNGRSHD